MSNKYYLPIEFWSFILASLDEKTEALCKRGGFGEIKVTLKIHRGTVSEVYFNDELRVRGVLEKINENLTKKSPDPAPKTK